MRIGDSGSLVMGEGVGRLEGDRELRAVLERARTVAVVGLSPRPGRPSHFVAAYLQRAGYRIVPVNPGHSRLLGERCHPSLRAIPVGLALDIVDVFRRPSAVPEVVRELIDRGAGGTVWLQPGCESEVAERLAVDAGLDLVAGLCLKTEHRRLIGRE